jgi:hypothetical protein
MVKICRKKALGNHKNGFFKNQKKIPQKKNKLNEQK